MASPFKDKHGYSLSWSHAFTKIRRRLLSYINDIATTKIFWLSFIPSHAIRRFSLRFAGVRIGRGSTIHSGIGSTNLIKSPLVKAASLATMPPSMAVPP
jgi:hypothetical protein